MEKQMKNLQLKTLLDKNSELWGQYCLCSEKDCQKVLENRQNRELKFIFSRQLVLQMFFV